MVEQMARNGMKEVLLRDVQEADLSIFFTQQIDPTANYMAAFTAKDPTDTEAFALHWAKIRNDSTIINRTILFEGNVAGHIAKFEQFGEPEVSYWIGKEYWGKGVATGALSEFLIILTDFPLYARAAKDNLPSLRVLKKCGFIICGYGQDFAHARGEDVEEVILKLEAVLRDEAQ